MRVTRLALMLALLWPLAAEAAVTPWQKNPHSAVRIVVDLEEVAAGRDVVDGGVQMTTRKGWHVYWRNSGDAGFAPSLVPDHSSDVAEVELDWPAPERYVLKGGLQAFGYTGEVLYPARFVLKAPARSGAPVKLAVSVDYLVCEDECIPYRYDVALALPVAAAERRDETIAEALASARARVPARRDLADDVAVEWRGDALIVRTSLDVREAFFDVHPLFDFGVPVRERDGQAITLRTPLKRKSAAALPEKTSFTLTLTGRAAPVETTREVRLAATEAPAQTEKGLEAGLSFWLMCLFGFIGGTLLNLMPCVLPVLSLKLLGLVEHHSPLEARRSAVWTSAGIASSFMALAGIALALRAAGRGAGWGVQFQEPLFVAFLSVVVVLFALSLWGVFELPLPTIIGRLASVGGRRGPLAHFSAGLFATLLATPCSAPFLGTAVAFALSSTPARVVAVFFAIAVGMSAPYLTLAVVPDLVRFLPRPGAWMVQLKQALGFALAATAVWLLFVLSGQLSQTQVALIELALLGMALAAWAIEAWRARPQLRFAASALLVVSALLTLVIARDTPLPGGGVEVVWETFDEARLETLVRAGRPVFVDVTADWCFTCKVNERAVLASERVASALIESGVVCMKADWTKRDEKIGAFLAAHGRTGIPFYLVRSAGSAPRVLPELLTERIVLDALKP